MAEGTYIKDLKEIDDASDSCDLIIEDDSPTTMRIKLGDLKSYITSEVNTQVTNALSRISTNETAIATINNDLSNLISNSGIKTYSNVSELGLNDDCSPSDVVQALPAFSILLSRINTLTNTEWNWPSGIERTLCVISGMDSGRSQLFLFGKVSSLGDYRMFLSNSTNLPDGVWYKITMT